MRSMLRMLIILVVVFALAGVFKGYLTPAAKVSIPGILLMLIGAAGALGAETIASKAEEVHRDRIRLTAKLLGVLLCGIGAIIVIGL